MNGMKGIPKGLMGPDILAQTLLLAQQPHMTLNMQTVKAEVYDPLAARKLSFSLSQKSLNAIRSSLLPKKWDNIRDGENYDENGDDESMDR